MKIKEMVDETVKSGITPIRLDFDCIDFFSDTDELPTEGELVIDSRHTGIVRSFIVIESLDLGTLGYKQYRFVARRTKQGNHLVRRHIEKIFRAYPELALNYPSAVCYTVPVYARLLKGGELAAMLFDAMTLFPDVPREKICIELSADILYEDIEEAKAKIAELRELGFKIAICEVGDEFCPVFRLSEIKFDYVFADKFAVNTLAAESADRVAGSLVKFLHFLDVKVIAPELRSWEQVADAKRVGFDGFGIEEYRDYTELVFPEESDDDGGEGSPSDSDRDDGQSGGEEVAE